jgi:hypothetical protein
MRHTRKSANRPLNKGTGSEPNHSNRYEQPSCEVPVPPFSKLCLDDAWAAFDKKSSRAPPFFAPNLLARRVHACCQGLQSLEAIPFLTHRISSTIPEGFQLLAGGRASSTTGSRTQKQSAPRRACQISPISGPEARQAIAHAVRHGKKESIKYDSQPRKGRHILMRRLPSLAYPRSPTAPTGRNSTAQGKGAQRLPPWVTVYPKMNRKPQRGATDLTATTNKPARPQSRLLQPRTQGQRPGKK